jgi:hypothetical protein
MPGTGGGAGQRPHPTEHASKLWTAARRSRHLESRSCRWAYLAAAVAAAAAELLVTEERAPELDAEGAVPEPVEAEGEAAGAPAPAVAAAAAGALDPA